MFKKKVISFFKNKKGGISIIFAMFALIMVVAIAAGRNIIFKKASLREVQSAMDISGVSALRSAINNDEQRLQGGGNNTIVTDVFDEQKAKTIYKTLLQQSLNHQNYISSYEIIDIKVGTHQDSKWRFDDNKARKEAFINSTIVVRYNAGMFDNLFLEEKTYYHSKEDEIKTYQYTGVNGDGLAEILVHSTSRIVFR